MLGCSGPGCFSCSSTERLHAFFLLPYLSSCSFASVSLSIPLRFLFLPCMLLCCPYLRPNPLLAFCTIPVLQGAAHIYSFCQSFVTAVACTRNSPRVNMYKPQTQRRLQGEKGLVVPAHQPLPYPKPAVAASAPSGLASTAEAAGGGGGASLSPSSCASRSTAITWACRASKRMSYLHGTQCISLRFFLLMCLAGAANCQHVTCCALSSQHIQPIKLQAATAQRSPSQPYQKFAASGAKAAAARAAPVAMYCSTAAQCLTSSSQLWRALQHQMPAPPAHSGTLKQTKAGR